MRIILFAVILSVLTLVSYSQDGIVWKVEKYRGEQLIYHEKLNNENIQISEKGGFIAFNEIGVFTLVESMPDSLCESCVSSYLGVQGDNFYSIYIFVDRVIFIPLVENCEDFIVYYYRKFNPLPRY